MRNLIFLTSLIVISSCGESLDKLNNKFNISYPESRTVNQVDTMWGTAVEDPYRWLEDDRDPEVEKWVIDQNNTTRSYLDAIPVREEIRARYESLFNYEKIGAPRKIGDRYFVSRNNGLQNQSVVYVRESLHGEETVFLDPNLLSDNGTVTAHLGGASKDGKYVAVIRNEAGSDWSQIRILDVQTGEEIGDVLDWVKFSGTSWLRSGFFYSRYPEPDGSEFSSENTFHSVYYHEIGTPQTEDQIVFRNDDEPNRYHFVSVTEDEKFMILNSSTGTDGNSLHIKDASDPSGSDWRELICGFTHRSGVVGHYDGYIYFITDIDSPRYRLVAVKSDADLADKSLWTDILPQSEDLLESVTSAGGQLFATYLRNASHVVVRYDIDGTNPREVVLPNAVGSVGGFGGRHDAEEVFYAFTSFTHPTSIYRIGLENDSSELFSSPVVDFDSEGYETNQVWYESKDGTQIPMFIVHRKGIVLDGENPTLLYAYGGFNISLTPSFSASEIVFLERGGVYAMPNLRGGGEFGEEWHEAGMLLKKQNVFDDFIAAAEFLISEGYTSSAKLAIEGRSNGGLLIGAVMAQRPDLARVAFPGVGVMDMLRYHKFTIGWGWIPEYGCADSSAVQFENLYGFSPVHNLVDGTSYPSTMVTTSDHDDRVVPAHSFKFAARLQAAHSGSAPALIRIEVNAGHGAGKPTSMIIDEEADKWAFLLHEVSR
jgi:prolyl oligopeptidase